MANKVIATVRSMGMALTPLHCAAAGKPTFTLAEDEVEIGMEFTVTWHSPEN